MRAADVGLVSGERHLPRLGRIRVHHPEHVAVERAPLEFVGGPDVQLGHGLLVQLEVGLLHLLRQRSGRGVADAQHAEVRRKLVRFPRSEYQERRSGDAAHDVLEWIAGDDAGIVVPEVEHIPHEAQHLLLAGTRVGTLPFQEAGEYVERMGFWKGVHAGSSGTGDDDFAVLLPVSGGGGDGAEP